MMDGRFKVCLNQGINIRMIDDDSARARFDHLLRRHLQGRGASTLLGTISATKSRFFAGVDWLENQGVPPFVLLVYMLVGYDKRETWERVLYRFAEDGRARHPALSDDLRRAQPAPAVGRVQPWIGHRTLSEFQRWAIRKAYTFIPFEYYEVNAKGRADKRQTDLFAQAPTM